MKKLATFIALILSLSAMAQVTNVPVTAGDTVTIRKNSSIVATFPASGLDSAFRLTFQKFQSVTPPPPAGDTLIVLSVSSKSGTAALTHTVTAPAGSLIILTTAYAGNLKNCIIGGSAALTWTKSADATASGSGDAEIYSSSVTTAGTYTITTNWGAGSQSSVAYVITGAEGIGAKGFVMGDAAPTINITTTKANSLLIAVSSDFNGKDGSGRIYRDGAVETFYKRADNKEGTGYHYTKRTSTIKQYTEGISSPSGQKAGTAIVEIKAKAGTATVPDTQAPSSPSLSSTGSTPSSISLSWTPATDNIGVAGYDVYVDNILKTSITGTSYSLTGLKSVTQYSIFVEAKDAAGNVGRSNTVTVTTQPLPNQLPVSRAGNDISITLPVNSTTLNGSGSTDADGTISLYSWTYISGPSAWTLTNANSVSTSLANLVQGSYTFRLTVTDNSGGTGADDIMITVNSAAPVDTTTAFKAEGFGSLAVGGSNSTTVYHVTNLNSSGSGSLTNGIGSNKTIVFDVSGTIVGRFDLANISFLTIDGGNQSIVINNNNNGDGISFDGANTHHCILKNIEVTNAGGDGINVVDGAHDILISNCTSHGNRDGNIDVAGDNSGLTKNVTVQWCIIGGGAPNASDYSGSTLITGQNVSLHHNLFVPAAQGDVGERCPLVHCNYSPVGSPNADIRYNTVWKFGRDNGSGSGFAIDIAYGAAGNAVGNYVYTTGGSNSNGVTTSAYGEPTGSLYAEGNISGNSGTNPNGQSNHAIYSIPAQSQITVAGTATACSESLRVIAKAGPKNRSSTAQGLVNSVPANKPGCSVQ